MVATWNATALGTRSTTSIGTIIFNPNFSRFLPEIVIGRSTYLDEAGLRRANSPSEILSQFGKILEFGKTRSAN
jgi:hypothetical protein